MNIAAPSRLESARVALTEHIAAFARINEAMRAVQAGTAPAAEMITRAADLKRQRRTVLQRLLRIGPATGTEPEVATLSKAIEKAEPLADAAGAVLEARDATLADLQREADALHPTTAVLQRELAEAQFEAASDEIRDEVQKVLKAFATFGEVYGHLLGLGRAHTIMATRLREGYGLHVQALGVERPIPMIELNPVGFNISTHGNFNQMRLDLGAQIARAAEEAVRQWSK